MKKKYLIIPALSLFALASCSKKIDDAYANPNALVKQPIETLLPNVISNMAVSYTANGTNYGPQNDGQYVGRYIQFWVTNTAANQYDMMGQTTTNSTAAAADIGGAQWASHYYGQGQNLNRIIEWGSEQKKWDYVGVAYAIRALGWLGITDMHGEVIVKDAFDPTLLVFDYDTQKDAYDEAKRCCRLAIEYLSKTGDSVSATNLEKGAAYITCKGDVEKWKKFTYATMARIFHRTTNKSDYQPDSVIYYANLSVNSNSDNVNLLWQGLGTSTDSYYGPFRGNIGSFRQSRFIADLMSGLNTGIPTGIVDPRAWYIIRENANGTFKGIRPAKGLNDGLSTNDLPQNFWGGTGSSTTGSNSAARYVFKDAMPWPIVTASEMQFLKAEAYYRKGDKTNALNAYKDGIRLNFDMLMNDYSASVPAPNVLTTTIRDNYMLNPLVVPTAANLNLTHIMLQKYIAMYGFGFMETWADMRRYHYVDVEASTTRQVYTDFLPPSGADLFANNNGKLIYRVRPRYNSEILYNADALQQLGALDLDYHTKKQWFTEP
jgi:hypothetical protein